MRYYSSFTAAINSVGNELRLSSKAVHTEKWQGIDVSKMPAAAMREVLNVSFGVTMNNQEDLDWYRSDIQPNLPWADKHFEERVSGKPLNPGETWRDWPWALSADKHRTQGDKFTHTYMERYWPRDAGSNVMPMQGIRYEYGDLQSVSNHLAADPSTRQAYLPVWFPEDTGVSHGGRVPCTLGYHWLLREGTLQTTYYIRSCDYYRHFRDDLYLSVRLTLWLLENLRVQDTRWRDVHPGLFIFHAVSMHLFVNDFRKLFK